MTTPTHVAPNARAGLASFDAYVVALRFYREVVAACRDLRGNAVDHLLDAAESVVLDVAEGHPAIGAERARKFRIAAGEASECAAALDLLKVQGALAEVVLSQLRTLLDRELAMLFRLGHRRR